MKNLLKISLLFLLFILIAPLFLCQNANAEEDNISRKEVVNILVNYFKLDKQITFDFENFDPNNLYTEMINGDSGYNFQFLCNEGIICLKNPDNIETMSSFLKIYYELKYNNLGREYIPNKYQLKNQEWFQPYFLEAVKTGLINQNANLKTLTKSQVLWILKKDYILNYYGNILPYYFNGLETNISNITVNNYYKLDQIDKIISEYDSVINYLNNLNGSVSDEDTAILITDTITQFSLSKNLFSSIKKMISENPLYFDQTYPQEIRDKWKELGIRQMLGFGYYDFHNSQGYRKHNIRVILNHMNGLILNSNEEFNFWKVMQAKGLGAIGNGWNLAGGSEVWEWGGGICGGATEIFRAAWFAGLEILQRSPHSAYYTSMYDYKDIGLDATVYTTGPNLRFRNNTDSPIYFYLEWDKNQDRATLKVFGNNKYKSMTFPELSKGGGYFIRKRILEEFNGNKIEEVMKSSYRKIY